MNEYDILVSVDDNFINPLGAMLHSLFINNPDRKINIHLMYSELTRESLDKVEAVTQKYSGGFYSYKVREEHKNASPVVGRFPAEAFFRLFAFEYIPKSIKKILYLDADIIVNGSIGDLYDTPLYDVNADGTRKKYLFAAVSSEREDTDREIAFRYKSRLSIPDSVEYVFSSLLLINLELLSEVTTVNEIFEVCESYKDYLIFPDQDLLNMLYYRYIRYLDQRKYYCYPLATKITTLNINDPVIIHYNGIKPWNERYPMYTQILRESKILYDIYAALEP